MDRLLRCINVVMKTFQTVRLSEARCRLRVEYDRAVMNNICIYNILYYIIYMIYSADVDVRNSQLAFSPERLSLSS